MLAPRRLLIIAAAAALGLLAAGGVAGLSGAATSLDGTWNGGDHPVLISGTLEGGFTISAGASYTWNNCPVPAGTELSRYAPTPGGLYSATARWFFSTNGVCTGSEWRDDGFVTVKGSANTLSISGCYGAVCGSFSRASKPPATTTTKPTTTKKPTKPRDRTPPTVRAIDEGRTLPGTRAKLDYVANDKEAHDRLTVHLLLYEGGRLIAPLEKPRTVSPSSRKRTWDRVLMASDLIGPMRYCLWAQDAAGNRSAGAPKSDCAWISLVAGMDQLYAQGVANGCGGGGWDVATWAQNYFGNEHRYFQSFSESHLVNFKDACDLHDAGYGGHTVRDRINGGIVDYHDWSRPRVDKKFFQDMKALCDQQIPAATGANAAREKCKSRGGDADFGAHDLYDFVAKFGWHFFDADLTEVGQQATGHRRQFDR